MNGFRINQTICFLWIELSPCRLSCGLQMHFHDYCWRKCCSFDAIKEEQCNNHEPNRLDCQCNWLILWENKYFPRICIARVWLWRIPNSWLQHKKTTTDTARSSSNGRTVIKLLNAEIVFSNGIQSEPKWNIHNVAVVAFISSPFDGPKVQKLFDRIDWFFFLFVR